MDEGAAEADIVISRGLASRGEWSALFDEIAAMRVACGAAWMEAILATGEIKTCDTGARASHVAVQAGADWTKTSTGKVGVNATLPVSLVMARAIRGHHVRTGRS